MTITPDDLAFRAAIAAEPRDDLPRLAYCDWLEENARSVTCRDCQEVRGPNGVRRMRYNLAGPDSKWLDCTTCHGSGTVSDGRAERAEFIRVQVELATSCHDIGMEGDCSEETGCRKCYLKRRERELWVSQAWYPRPGIPIAYGLTDDSPTIGEGGASVYAQVQRGFVSVLRGPLSAFWVAGRVSGPTPALVEICAREPVERVEVTDRTPWRSATGEFAWLDDDGLVVMRAAAPAGIPSPLMTLIPKAYEWNSTRIVRYFPTADDASRALSDAILKAARGKTFTPAT